MSPRTCRCGSPQSLSVMAQYRSVVARQLQKAVDKARSGVTSRVRRGGAGVCAAGEIWPEPHLSTESKDAIKLPTAIVATLSAIALGLLTASAKTTFDRAEVQLKTTVAQVVVLDRVMVSYGPQTQEARRLLRDFVVTQLDPSKRGTATSEFGIEAVQNKLRSLVPETAPHRLLQ